MWGGEIQQGAGSYSLMPDWKMDKVHKLIVPKASGSREGKEGNGFPSAMENNVPFLKHTDIEP